MAETVTSVWNAEERALVDAILNQIIPAGDDRQVPAAGDLGVGEFVAGRVVSDRGLRALFGEGLEVAAGIGVGDAMAVKRVEDASPDFFAALQRLTYMGYYSRPDVREVLGLSPKPVHPDGYNVPSEPAELLAELTAPVRARGACYRDV